MTRTTVHFPLLMCALASSACTSCASSAPEVQWPASPDVPLAVELAASAREAGEPPPLLADGTYSTEVDLPPDAPGIRARSFVFEGLWVAEVEIGHVDRGAALPLVMMLHGRADRPRVPGGPFGRVPTPMRVLIPRGPLAIGSGYAWARFSVTEHRDAELAEDLIAISARLARLLRHVKRTRPTLGSPIVTGFSQGAITAWTMALRHPDIVGLVLPLAGWVPPGARPVPLVSPMLLRQRSIHGTDDPIVRIGPTRELVDLLRRQGADIEWIEEERTAHTVSPRMNALFETWLEEGLQERAPGLAGGLGVVGEDPVPVEPHEAPVDDGTESVKDDEAVPAPLPLEVLEQDEAPELETSVDEGEADEREVEEPEVQVEDDEGAPNEGGEGGPLPNGLAEDSESPPVGEGVPEEDLPDERRPDGESD